MKSVVVSGLFASLPCFMSVNAQDIAEQTAANILTRPSPEGFSELSKRLMPAVVNISTSQRVISAGLPDFPQNSPIERFNDLFGRDDDGLQRTSSLGSGFVISDDGFIVTNNHVIEGADEIEVTFSDGRNYPAELIGRDPDTDIAVLKIETPAKLTALDFADSDASEVGDWVIAIGNPFGLGGSVSAGIISARDRDINAGSYDNFIQTDAAINRGNSGGPLFTLDGDVVGVNTAIISPTGGSVGIGFSVPSNLVAYIVDQLIAHGEVRRGWLGINIQGVDRAIAQAYGLSGTAGVIITQVDEGGPGEEAGLREGDLILKYDGKLVTDTRGLSRNVAESSIGTSVSLDIVREGDRRSLDVEIKQRPSDELNEDDETNIPSLFVGANGYGIKLAEISDEARRRWNIPRPTKGALIDMVDPDGPAYGILEKGDVITEINFNKVTNAANADSALEAAAGADPVLVKVYRRGRVAFHALQIEA